MSNLEDQVRHARAIIADYSDLHDGVLTSFHLEGARTLTITFVAEHFETVRDAAIIVSGGGVRKFIVSVPPHDRAGFEDYSFPTNTLVDTMDIAVQGDLVRTVVRGTYGWCIEVLAQSIATSIQATASPDCARLK